MVVVAPPSPAVPTNAAPLPRLLAYAQALCPELCYRDVSHWEIRSSNRVCSS